MGWKIIAFLYAAGYVWMVFDPAYEQTAFRMITAAFFLPAVVGLFLFAFGRRFLPRLLWKTYTILIGAYLTLPFVFFGVKIMSGGPGLVVEVILVAAYSLCVLPIVRSLWWLSFERTESASPRMSEASVP